jgi:hypothetical protein
VFESTKHLSEMGTVSLVPKWGGTGFYYRYS